MESIKNIASTAIGARQLFVMVAGIFAASILFASQASAVEPPVVEAPVDPPVPVATMLFSDTPGVRSFTVTFSEPMNVAEVEDLSKYFLVNTATPEQGASSLVGLATAVYDAETRTVTLTVLDPTQPIRAEYLAWGIRPMLSESGTLSAETVAPSAPRVAPLAPDSLEGVRSADGTSITWSWTAAVDQGEYASGIRGYGYRVLKDGALIETATDVLEASALQYTLADTTPGVYVLQLWALDSVGEVSDEVASEITIIKTPPVGEPGRGNGGGAVVVVDEPIEPLPEYEYVSRVAFVAPSYGAYQDDEGGYEATDDSAARVAATNQPTEATPTINSLNGDAEPTMGVLAPTRSGWSIFGILWYWWLLPVAIVVTAGLWVRSIRKDRDASDF